MIHKYFIGCQYENNKQFTKYLLKIQTRIFNRFYTNCYVKIKQLVCAADIQPSRCGVQYTQLLTRHPCTATDNMIKAIICFLFFTRTRLLRHIFLILFIFYRS